MTNNRIETILITLVDVYGLHLNSCFNPNFSHQWERKESYLYIAQ